MKIKFIKYISLTIFLIFISCSSGDDGNSQPDPTPVVTLYADQIQAAVQKNILFSINGEIPNDIANINWDFGDGTLFYGNSSHQSVYHPFTSTGNYIVKAKILRQNGALIETTKTVTIVNTNLIKVTSITVQTYPEKLCEKFVASGSSGYWVSFYGKWDESNGFGSIPSDVNRYADTYLELVRHQKVPNSTNPSELVGNVNNYGLTPVHLNQLNNVFDVSNFNIVLSLNAIDAFAVGVYDDDSTNSIYENGSESDVIGTLFIEPSSFQNNSFLITNSSNQLVIKVDYINLN